MAPWGAPGSGKVSIYMQLCIQHVPSEWINVYEYVSVLYREKLYIYLGELP